MAASYPTSAKSFTTKSNSDATDASQINDVQDEITAIETDLVAGLPLARGGTGLTSLAANRVPYSSGSALTSAAGLTFDGTTLTATAVSGATVTSTGQVVISGASAGQIVFPATQNASSNANTLDDYEEGTWTPSLGGNATYTVQTGHYTKIGRLVAITGTITVNVIGTGSTTTITGVPFAEGVSGVAPVAVGNYASLASAVYDVGGYLTGSSIVISANTAAGTASGTAAVFGNSASIDFSCTYFA